VAIQGAWVLRFAVTGADSRAIRSTVGPAACAAIDRGHDRRRRSTRSISANCGAKRQKRRELGAGAAPAPETARPQAASGRGFGRKAARKPIAGRKAQIS